MMSAPSGSIHPTAIVAPGARLEEGVRIGPYCVVGATCTLERGVTLMSHVVVEGVTTLGAETQVWPFASLGSPPQDVKYRGEPSRLLIGPRNRIREHVTINPGTVGGGMETRIGADGLFMVGVHIAHDCKIGDRVIMANNATLGGHVVVGDCAVIGGLVAVHQFVRIGAHAMIGGMSGVDRDVIPYGSVAGERARLCGLNAVGLQRRDFSRQQIGALREAYQALFGEAADAPLSARIAAVAQRFAAEEVVMDVIRFLQEPSSRGLTKLGQ